MTDEQTPSLEQKVLAEKKAAEKKPEEKSEPTASAKSAKVTPDKPKTSPKATPKKSVWGMVNLFLWCVLIAAIIVSAYFAWQFWLVQNTRMQTMENHIEEQSTWFASSISQQADLLEKQQFSLAELNTALINEQVLLQQRLDAHANRLNTLSGSRRDGWMLEEARYLLRLANQRQLTGGGAQGIIGLLQSADATLRELDAPDLFPIRESLRKEIVALQLAPKVDREGIYLTLSAVLDRISQLPPVPLTSSLEKPEEQTAIVEEDMTWSERVLTSVRQAMGKFDSYVRVNQHDQPLTPLLSETQQRVMAQNLRLMLEQAQIALLREEAKIYQTSLEKVITWLNSHYAHFPEKNALVEQIQLLQQQNIVNVVPNVSSSLAQLTDYITTSKTLEQGGAQTNTDNQEDPAAQSDTPEKETAL